MSTAVRALVMLFVLVALPVAWIHSGPLPEGAQRVVDRAVALGRESFGLPPLPSDQPGSWPPSFDPATVLGRSGPSKSASAAANSSREATLDGDFGAGWSEASTIERDAAMSGYSAATAVDDSFGARAEPLLARLRELGVVEYALEHWGSSGTLYRFHCRMPLAGSPDHTRQFESVATDPLASIQQVVAEASSWQVARVERGVIR